MHNMDDSIRIDSAIAFEFSPGHLQSMILLILTSLLYTENFIWFTNSKKSTLVAFTLPMLLNID